MLVTENIDNAINPATTVAQLPDYFVYKQYGKPLSIWRKCNSDDDCIVFDYDERNLMQLFIVMNVEDNSFKLKGFSVYDKVKDIFNLDSAAVYPAQEIEITEINVKY